MQTIEPKTRKSRVVVLPSKKQLEANVRRALVMMENAINAYREAALLLKTKEEIDNETDE